MRSSLRKLRGLGLQRSELREKRDHRPRAKLDELVQAAQDMQDMKSCYDGLLSSAAATANSAYEFSEALREMGTCLLEKTALHDDEEGGRVLLMLGKAQFELQKLVNNYRTHIIQTITTPSECLLGELQIVEEMKQQCDEKRDFFKLMLAAPRVRGKSRNSKGEAVTVQQLQAAREDYEEDANLFIFRLKSLKQGQSRSLLTQAARHHAAQLNFFKKGHKSLEVIEPHVKSVTEQQHIDYHFRGLEDDSTDFDDGRSFCSDSSGDGELSFDYDLNEQAYNTLTTNLMEVDQVDSMPTKEPSLELVQENLAKKSSELLFHSKKPNIISQSAPIFADIKYGLYDKMRDHPPPQSARKYHTYALPTPIEVRNSAMAAPNISFSQSLPKSHSGLLQTDQTQHKPADPKDKNSPSPTISPKTPPNDRLLPKLNSFVGRSPATTSITSPMIGTLHELPRPPIAWAQSGAPNSFVGHSEPLISRNHEIQTSRAFPTASQTVSLLPAPPDLVSRSFSTPYKQFERRRNLNAGAEEPVSPLLTPLALGGFAAASRRSGQI